MTLDAVQILYFVADDTGRLRNTCPSSGALLDRWYGDRRRFEQAWGALREVDQRANYAAAIEMVSERGVGSLNFPRRFAVGALGGVYRPVARASEALPQPRLYPDAPGYDVVLFLRITPGSIDRRPVLWWVAACDVTWLHSDKDPC